MNALTIRSRLDEPGLFSRWEALPEFSESLAHAANTSAGNRYYEATLDNVVDASFAVMRGVDPLMLVRCNLANGKLSHFIRPISLIESKAIPERDRKSLIGAALNAIDKIASRGAVSVAVGENGSGKPLSDLGSACVSRHAQAQLMQTAQCDLSLDEQQIHRSTRKSFRSLINWGRRNMSLEYFNAKNQDESLFDAYRTFHGQVAGRITRSETSWRAMRDWVLESGGELALAYLDNKQLVAGTMTVDGKEQSLYASGVYDRTQFDKPLAHFPLYDAILRSRARGLKSYELGNVPAKGTVNDKEYNIGFFKSGFATSIETHTVWTWSVDKDAAGRS